MLIYFSILGNASTKHGELEMEAIHDGDGGNMIVEYEHSNGDGEHEDIDVPVQII